MLRSQTLKAWAGRGGVDPDFDKVPEEYISANAHQVRKLPTSSLKAGISRDVVGNLLHSALSTLQYLA